MAGAGRVSHAPPRRIGHDVPMSETRGRVIGIGGIFFKSADHERLRAWYAEELGISQEAGAAMFTWHSEGEEGREHQTVWSVFPQGSTYFDPSAAPFMINYIVDDLDAFLTTLQARGVRIDPKREDHEYGRFAWVYDPDGNKLELWQPPPG
jgi:catechol 2,3-dioxygenase-like lactoylglutathione lyase family enzyme